MYFTILSLPHFSSINRFLNRWFFLISIYLFSVTSTRTSVMLVYLLCGASFPHAVCFFCFAARLSAVANHQLLFPWQQPDVTSVQMFTADQSCVCSKSTRQRSGTVNSSTLLRAKKKYESSILCSVCLACDIIVLHRSNSTWNFVITTRTLTCLVSPQLRSKILRLFKTKMRVQSLKSASWVHVHVTVIMCWCWVNYINVCLITSH